MTTPAGPEILGRYHSAIESALEEAIGSGGTPLQPAARYVLGWEDERGQATVGGGKRIRPSLCLFAAEAFGGAIEAALPGAVAIELVHNFSLVHDEIQDHDMVRHSRPTTFARLGEAQAINVGDFLYNRAILALAGANGDSARRLDALQVLNSAIDEMIRGQWEDLTFETREQVSPAEYLSMVAGKTGALLAAPLEIGAILAAAPPDAARSVGEWGARVGAAFQAQDDYLGIWGDPDITGKSNTNDIARRKKTLPVVHGLNDPLAGPVIRRVYGQPAIEPDDVEAVVSALERAGSHAFCREHARSQAAEADRILETVHMEQARRDEFRAIARYLVEREA